MKTARKLIEEYSDLGLSTLETDDVEAGVSSLISQLPRVDASPGITIATLMIDEEDGVICVELLVGGNPVAMYFYLENEIPMVGVDWDNDDDIDCEFDISPMDPPSLGGLVDVSSINAWMNPEVFRNLIFNDWSPMDPRNEAISLDQYEGGWGSENDEDFDSAAMKKKHKKYKVVNLGGYWGYAPLAISAPHAEPDGDEDDDHDADDMLSAPAVPSGGSPSGGGAPSGGGSAPAAP